MLAYVFWHQPASGATAYADALLRFHEQLHTERVAGVVGTRALRVPDLPWLPGGGYEDWYYVEDFAALGALNGAAVDAAHKTTHDAVANMSGTGVGGLYALRTGAWDHRAAHHTWLDHRPPAVAGALWQRQMVLGPAPEYCLVSDAPVADATLTIAVSDPAGSPSG
ncbi:MAG: hypothetical protein ACYDH6_13710 [Acidimicrobiales bacterium]